MPKCPSVQITFLCPNRVSKCPSIVSNVHVFPQVYIVDAVFFSHLLPWYKERVRGPHLPFERLEEELRGKSGWPPIGDCKNNEIKIGEEDKLTQQRTYMHNLQILLYLP